MSRRSQNSVSDANNAHGSLDRTSNVQTSYGKASCGPLCECGRSTTVMKSWTTDNPGRRFFKCTVHGFVSWADLEKPHGWQKVSLSEVRDEIRQYKDEIRQYKEEINSLKESLRVLNHQQMEEMKVHLNSEVNNKHEEEDSEDEVEVIVSKEREKLLRQFIVISWGAFILVIALILMMK